MHEHFLLHSSGSPGRPRKSTLAELLRTPASLRLTDRGIGLKFLVHSHSYGGRRCVCAARSGYPPAAGTPSPRHEIGPEKFLRGRPRSQLEMPLILTPPRISGAARVN